MWAPLSIPDTSPPLSIPYPRRLYLLPTPTAASALYRRCCGLTLPLSGRRWCSALRPPPISAGSPLPRPAAATPRCSVRRRSSTCDPPHCPRGAIPSAPNLATTDLGFAKLLPEQDRGGHGNGHERPLRPRVRSWRQQVGLPRSTTSHGRDP
jgi:hypothetical protein